MADHSHTHAVSTEVAVDHHGAGVIWLLSLLAIDFKRGLKPHDELAVDMAALYWHFVDVVWIVIFTLVYLIQ